MIAGTSSHLRAWSADPATVAKPPCAPDARTAASTGRWLVDSTSSPAIDRSPSVNVATPPAGTDRSEAPDTTC